MIQEETKEIKTEPVIVGNGKMNNSAGMEFDKETQELLLDDLIAHNRK
jgi:hypothetical protein